MAATSQKVQKVKVLKGFIKAQGEELDPAKKYAKKGDVLVVPIGQAQYWRSMTLVDFIEGNDRKAA